MEATLKITAGQVLEAIDDYGNEYVQERAARALKRTYDVVERHGYSKHARGVVVETPNARVQVFAYVDHNYGKEPRVKVVMQAIDDLHYGRQQYLQVPNVSHRFADGEYMPLTHTSSYLDRKAEEDLGSLLRVYWRVFAETYPDVLHEVVSKANNEIVQGKLDKLKEEMQALQDQLM